MANIIVPGLPAKIGTILNTAYLHLNESGVDKKMTVAQFLAKIEAQYSADIISFLGSANKAEGRANLSIDRRVTINNTNYTILATDKVVAQIGTMSTARTFSLPEASTVQAGAKIIIVDESGSVDIVNKIIVQRNGADTIDGQTSIDINKKYGQLELICNGTDGWKIVSSGASILQNDFINKNLIINGDMEIAQRGKSFASVVNGSYSLDRWIYGKSGSMVHDITQEADAPGVAEAGRYIGNSIKVNCTTADASIAAGDYCFLGQYVEGYNFRKIAQKKFTLSFWVKATKTGTYCVAFVNSGYDRGFIGEYTINASDTWEFKTITVDASPSAGTWDYSNGSGLRVEFALACGSTRHTTVNAWNTGDFLSTPNQANACDAVNNEFYLAGVQVEEGEIASNFEKRSIQKEIELCQRYFEKSYDLNVDIGTANTTYMTFFDIAAAVVYTISSEYSVRKRSTATIGLYDDLGNLGNVTTTIGNVPGNVNLSSNRGFSATATATANRSSFLRYNWSADSEL